MPAILQKKDRENWLNGMETAKIAIPYEIELEAEPI